MSETHAELLQPAKLWTRAEIFGSDDPVPREPGVYAWYFRDVPPLVPTHDCVMVDGLTLLYVGIAPKPPPRNGRQPSTQTLRHRIRYHLQGNAAGSTLRLTLGCLLRDSLGIQLRRVGSGKRLTFADDEQRLSAWLGENAGVAWMVHPEPWQVEEELIRQLSLPLNLDQNNRHPFHPVLSSVRRDAKAAAWALPVVKPRYQPRPTDDGLQAQAAGEVFGDE